MTDAPQGYYAASAGDAVPYPSLSGAVRTAVCVVGGGYTGLSAALHLAGSGIDTVLLEAQTIGFAASGRNGGQIHSGHRKDQASLEQWLGERHAHALWDLAEEAKSLVRALIAKHQIACDPKQGLVIAAHDKQALLELGAETERLRRFYGYDAALMLDAAAIASKLGTDIYPGGRFDAGGGHLHPLKFARGLSLAAQKAGVKFYENSPALSVDKRTGVVRCARGTVDARMIILACDAFTGILVPELGPYIGHVESFIAATEPLAEDIYAKIIPSDVAVADTRHVLDYYRKSQDRRLLFAGRESYWSVPSDIARLVRPRMARVYPALAETPLQYAWSGTVGITRTRMPHFGRLGDRVLFGHGYSGHGVALSVMGGKALAEAAQGRSETFDMLANVPARKFPGGAYLRKPMIAAALLWFKLMDAL